MHAEASSTDATVFRFIIALAIKAGVTPKELIELTSDSHQMVEFVAALAQEKVKHQVKQFKNDNKTRRQN